MTPTMYFVEFITFNHCIHHIPNLIKNYCRFTQNFSSPLSKFMPLWHALHKKFTYYAGIMLDAFTILLCSKLCWHNWLRPTCRHAELYVALHWSRVARPSSHRCLLIVIVIFLQPGVHSVNCFSVEPCTYIQIYTKQK